MSHPANLSKERNGKSSSTSVNASSVGPSQRASTGITQPTSSRQSPTTTTLDESTQPAQIQQIQTQMQPQRPSGFTSMFNYIIPPGNQISRPWLTSGSS